MTPEQIELVKLIHWYYTNDHPYRAEWLHILWNQYAVVYHNEPVNVKEVIAKGG